MMLIHCLQEDISKHLEMQKVHKFLKGVQMSSLITATATEDQLTGSEGHDNDSITTDDSTNQPQLQTETTPCEMLSNDLNRVFHCLPKVTII